MKKLTLIGIALLIASVVHFANAAEETTYSNNYDMRSQKKMGLGLTLGGPLGVAGLITELNFEKDNSGLAGLGTGPGYNSFILSWKRTFEGTYVTPYTLLGFSHWFSNKSEGDPRQSAILQQVLSENEMSTQNFGESFFAGSLGLQYNHLHGDFAGLSFLIQFDLLQSWKKNVGVLTGGLGAIYYF